MNLCNHFLKINDGHRLHVSLQELFIELSPSVVSKNHAVATQQSLDVCPHVRQFCSAAAETNQNLELQRRTYND